MAQRVQVMLLCDMHDEETEGVETLRFSVDGRNYEIDLCADHARQLRDALAPFIGAGRRTGFGGRRGRRGASSGAAAEGVDPAAVRAWARSKGIAVSTRGRIPADLIEQYRAAGF